MRAQQVADALHARPAGPGRWMAHCPAHDDRSPSLSIAEGAGGRVLLHCFSGCDYRGITTALRARGIEVGTPLTPAQRALAARERAEREEADAAKRQRERRRYDLLGRADADLDGLAAQLAAVTWAGAPGDGDGVAARYHTRLDHRRGLEGPA